MGETSEERSAVYALRREPERPRRTGVLTNGLTKYRARMEDAPTRSTDRLTDDLEALARAIDTGERADPEAAKELARDYLELDRLFRVEEAPFPSRWPRRY
jgi:hypothetical protein